MADGIAVEGMRLVSNALVRAVHTPSDLDARGQMLAAAAMGATAFQKGLGGMHALAHPIGALYDTHHGMTNATLMPYVLKFNRPAIEERITRLAAYLHLPSPGFDSFLAFVLKLRKDIAVPHTLFELGVDDKQADLIADMAIVDPVGRWQSAAVDQGRRGGNFPGGFPRPSLELIEGPWSKRQHVSGCKQEQYDKGLKANPSGDPDGCVSKPEGAHQHEPSKPARHRRAARR